MSSLFSPLGKPADRAIYFCLIFLLKSSTKLLIYPPLAFFSINAAERHSGRVFNHAAAAAYRQSVRRRRQIASAYGSTVDMAHVLDIRDVQVYMFTSLYTHPQNYTAHLY